MTVWVAAWIFCAALAAVIVLSGSRPDPTYHLTILELLLAVDDLEAPMPDLSPDQLGPCEHIWSVPEPLSERLDDGGFVVDPSFTVKFCLTCGWVRTEETHPETETR